MAITLSELRERIRALEALVDPALEGRVDDLETYDAALAATFGLPSYLAGNQIVYVNSGTFVKASFPGLKAVDVEGVGGGGGSGGADGTGSGVAAGACGGGAGWFRKRILVAALAATETVTIGNGGAAGTSAGGNGGVGGTTSFGAHATALGGGGGNGMTPRTATNAQAVGGASGSATLGDLMVDGGYGGGGIVIGGAVFIMNAGGSQLGNGIRLIASGDSVGTAGQLYGTGAGGARSNSATARAGGIGGKGVLLVTPLY